MRLLLPLVIAALWLAAPAQALVLPRTEGVEDAQLYADPDGQPRASLAFVKGRELWTDTLGADWLPSRKALLPDDTGRVAGVRPPGATLVESRNGSWLRLYVVAGPSRWREVKIADAPKQGQLGPAGLTLNRSGRPTVAYSVRRTDGTTELWLVQVSASRVSRTRVTRNGFPISVVPPAAQPLLMPNGTLRVVQTYAGRGANALLWRREGNRWWGRFLHAGSLGVPPLPIAASNAGENVFLAWTIAYAVQRELHVLLTWRTDRSRSIVLHRNATAAGLVLAPTGPEVAANENVAGLTAGLVFPALDAAPPVEVDGRIVGYALDAMGVRQLLLARNGRLEWFIETAVPAVRIVLDAPLAGRVENTTGGLVRLYRERAGVPRELVAEAPLAADGRFAFVDPALQSGSRYRIVYERGTFDVPYALLVREPVP